jgi:hypothetical protein
MVPTDTVTKTCVDCQQDKPLTGYHHIKNRRGVPYPRKACRLCWNAAQRKISDRRVKATVRQRNNRAAQRAEVSTSVENSELLRDLQVWYREGCPIRRDQKRVWL